MPPKQAVAYVNAQVACALIEMESMKALNTWRESRGESIAYDHDAFFDLTNRYCINHNAVIETFQLARE